MGARKRILIVMPSFPLVESGAEQQERAEGIRQMVRLGMEIMVIAKIVPWMKEEDIEAKAREWGIEVRVVPYYFSNRKISGAARIKKFFGKFRNPLYFDGAAYEFAEPHIQRVFGETLQSFKPDAIWFEYTYLWPLYSQAKKAGIPIVTRSQNFEPEHFLQERGSGLLNYLKFLPKYFGERYMARHSDIVAAITPQEAARYRALGAKNAVVLPLRSLQPFTKALFDIKDRRPLNVFFMGSSYSVDHNRAAARQVIAEIAPQALSEAPGTFVFHILGSKLPEDLQQRCDGKNIIYEGYVQDLNEFLKDVDIALIPSLMGAGMQQKVFEPLARGIPTITSPRAIAGYPFESGEEYLGAHSTGEFVKKLFDLQNEALRRRISNNALEKSALLFSREAMDAIVRSTLNSV